MIPPVNAPRIERNSRRVAAASFRCRRRRFAKKTTQGLAALAALLLAVLILTRHGGYESHYQEECGYEMDRTLLTLLGWEKASPAWRWLTFDFSREDFLSTQQSLATGAERHGYISDDIRLRVVLTAQYLNQRDVAEQWAQDITDPATRPWSDRALAHGVSQSLLEELLQDARRDVSLYPAPGQSPAVFYCILHEPGINAAAQSLLRRKYWRSGFELATFAWGIVSIRPLLKLLLRRGHAPRPGGARLVQRWSPQLVWSAWLRAEWCFLFSGMALRALFGLTWLASEWESRPAFVRILEPALTGYAAFVNSIFGPLCFVVLLTGAVFLMVRWLTPGFHGTLRLFGIRRSPLTGREIGRTALAGLALVLLLYFVTGILVEWLGIRDWRDSWVHGNEHLWEQILFGCLVAPFAEEFIFRGFLFTGFCTAMKPATASAFSSLLFALMHSYSPAGLLIIWAFGMLMCALYRRTGTLLVPMAVHALTNAMLLS